MATARTRGGEVIEPRIRTEPERFAAVLGPGAAPGW